MISNGCSGGMDKIAAMINRLRGKGHGQRLHFTGCCDQHDLFYAQGGTSSTRRFADALLKDCIRTNLLVRGKKLWVARHVAFFFWIAVRLFGWIYWGKGNAKVLDALLDTIVAKRWDYRSPPTCPPNPPRCQGGDDKMCRRCWLVAALNKAQQ